MHKNFIYLSIIYFLLFATGCSTEDYVAIVGSIEGKVIDVDTNEPIIACEVISKSNGTKLTDENGRFSFADVEAGVTELTYKAKGYETATREITVKAGNTVSANASLKAIVTQNDIYPNKTILDFGNRLGVQDLILKNPTNSSISYRISSDAEWITADPDHGVVPANKESVVKISANRENLSPGSYEKLLTIATADSKIEVQILVDKGDISRPVVNTLSVAQSNETPTSIIAEGTIAVVGSTKISQHGFCYAIEKSPTLEDNDGFINLGDINYPANFKGIILNLQYEKEYHIRAYATNEVGTGYGEEMIITLHEKKNANVVTSDASEISSFSACLNGKIENGNISSFEEVGFYYGNTPDCTEKSKDAEGKDNVFSVVLSDLQSDTDYYYKAFGKDPNGVKYGEVKAFHTNKSASSSDGKISIVTTEASNITPTSATLNGAISIKDKAEIKEIGFFYGTSSNPTLRLKVNSYSTPHLFTSTSFSGELTNLDENTKYYFQSYVIDKNNTIIKGEVKSFTTINSPQIVVNWIKVDDLYTGPLGDHDYVVSGEATIYPYKNKVIEAGFICKYDGYNLTYQSRDEIIQCEIAGNKISFSNCRVIDYRLHGGVYIKAYMILSDGSIIYNGDKIYVAYDLPYNGGSGD